MKLCECKGQIVPGPDPAVSLWRCEECDNWFTDELVATMPDHREPPELPKEIKHEINGLRDLVEGPGEREPFWTVPVQTERHGGFTAVFADEMERAEAANKRQDERPPLYWDDPDKHYAAHLRHYMNIRPDGQAKVEDLT